MTNSPQRRYRVGYALACGNTFNAPCQSFYSLRVAETYADWFRVRLARRYATHAGFITDLRTEERGDVYGTEEDT